MLHSRGLHRAGVASYSASGMAFRLYGAAAWTGPSSMPSPIADVCSIVPGPQSGRPVAGLVHIDAWALRPA
jgi:hypothetical protein